MALKYSITRHKNPADPASPTLYYPTLKASGRLNLDQVATLVNRISSVKRPTIVAVLLALLTVIPQELANGFIVELGEFGTFRLTIHTRGTTNRQEVTRKNILKAKAHFRPGKVFRKELAHIEFDRNPSVTKPPRR